MILDGLTKYVTAELRYTSTVVIIAMLFKQVTCPIVFKYILPKIMKNDISKQCSIIITMMFLSHFLIGPVIFALEKGAIFFIALSFMF